MGKLLVTVRQLQRPVLAQAMIQGLKNVTSGANPVGWRGIDKAVKVAVEALHENSQELKIKGEIAQVGAISAANEESGRYISWSYGKS